MRNVGWVGMALLVGCTSSSTEATPSGNATGTTSTAATCSDTAGATWTPEKSRFAFGGTPVPDGSGRYTGPGGTGLTSPGYADFILNAGSPDQGRPDFTSDSEALKVHVKEYLMGFGIQQCQIATEIGVLGSGGGGGPVGGQQTTFAGHRTISLARVSAGIPVVESHANAVIDDEDKSTSESILWPELPGDVVAQAKAFRDELATPEGLAAFKAKLPENSRGEGAVGIHHTLPFGQALAFDVGWDTQTASTGQFSGQPVTYDRDGKVLVQGGGPK